MSNGDDESETTTHSVGHPPANLLFFGGRISGIIDEDRGNREGRAEGRGPGRR